MDKWKAERGVRNETPMQICEITRRLIFLDEKLDCRHPNSSKQEFPECRRFLDGMQDDAKLQPLFPWGYASREHARINSFSKRTRIASVARITNF